MLKKLADDRVGHASFTIFVTVLFLLSMIGIAYAMKDMRARITALEAKQEAKP